MRITDVRVVVHERQTIRNAPPLPPDGRMPMGVLRILTLWDLAGKVAGLPVHRLLGTCRTHRTPQDYVDEVAHYRAAGWHVADGTCYPSVLLTVRIPIVATEITEGGLQAMPAWLAARRATDVLRGDVILKGGITPLMKIAHLADAFHVNCEVHDGFNALGNAACLNVVLAITNCEMFEVITINPAGTYGIDHLSYGLAEPIEFDADRNALAPTRPGLGYAIDWDLIDASVIGELS